MSGLLDLGIETLLDMVEDTELCDDWRALAATSYRAGAMAAVAILRHWPDLLPELVSEIRPWLESTHVE